MTRDFSKAIGDFSTRAVTAIEKTLEGGVEDLVIDIVMDTPTWFDHEKHSGNTRYNWTAKLNSPSSKYLKGTDKDGDKTLNRAAKKIHQWSQSNSANELHFTNNCPWIWWIEDGLYPNPPDRGSYNTQTKEWEKRSSGGYSKQAPQGMVKNNTPNFVPYIEKARKRNKI